MLTAEFLKKHFDAGLPYERYVRTGKPEQQENWARVHGRAQLIASQRSLIGAFTRRMPVLVSSGIWCGDCSAQCPLLARIAEGSPPSPLGGEGRGEGSRLIDLRFVDRDEHRELSERIMICAGLRVPTVIFMAEDYEFVGLLGDRTLSRYRAVAKRQLGAACPLPGAPIDQEELAATMQDWVDEFERIHLLLRLSPRLRERHGD